MRILTVANVPPDPNSGAAGTVVHTNRALRELGNEVHELWSSDLGLRRIRHGNVHSWLEQPRMYCKAILNVLKSQPAFDVIQISQPQAYLAARALKKRGFPGLVINRSHGLELRVNAVVPAWHRRMGIAESRFPRSLVTPLLRKLQERQWPTLLENVDGLALTCELDREFLESCFPDHAARLRVIHHGVSPQFVDRTPLPMTISRVRKLLYVGQYSFIKGPSILVQVVNEVLRMHPELTMTWVTSGDAHDAINGMLSADVRERVSLLNWLPQEELLPLYDSHGVFLFPSFFEGAGKASLEAMSRGMCTITSRTGAMAEYLDSERGVLCDVGHVSHFVAAIQQVISDLQEAQRMSRSAAEYARLKTWRRCAENYCEWFDALASQPHCSLQITGA